MSKTASQLGPLDSRTRAQLARVRRYPVEARWSSSTFLRLQQAGLVSGRPLLRPSGKPSAFREYSITERGLEALAVRP